MLKTTTL